MLFLQVSVLLVTLVTRPLASTVISGTEIVALLFPVTSALGPYVPAVTPLLANVVATLQPALEDAVPVTSPVNVTQN